MLAFLVVSLRQNGAASKHTPFLKHKSGQEACARLPGSSSDSRNIGLDLGQGLSFSSQVQADLRQSWTRARVR